MRHFDGDYSPHTRDGGGMEITAYLLWYSTRKVTLHLKTEGNGSVVFHVNAVLAGVTFLAKQCVQDHLTTKEE